MAKRLAETLGLAPDRVSVKAKSPEGLGLLGREEGIAAMAVVAVEVPERTRRSRGGRCRIYNTMTRKKEELRPAHAGRGHGSTSAGSRCTTYSHIGHARSAIVFDVIAPLPALRAATR